MPNLGRALLGLCGDKDNGGWENLSRSGHSSKFGYIQDVLGAKAGQTIAGVRNWGMKYPPRPRNGSSRAEVVHVGCVMRQCKACLGKFD